MERLYMYKNLGKSEPLGRRRAALVMMDGLFAFSFDCPPVFSVSLALSSFSPSHRSSLSLCASTLSSFLPSTLLCLLTVSVPRTSACTYLWVPWSWNLLTQPQGLWASVTLCMYNFFLCLFIQVPKSNWSAQMIFCASHLKPQVDLQCINSAQWVNHL